MKKFFPHFLAFFGPFWAFVAFFTIIYTLLSIFCTFLALFLPFLSICSIFHHYTYPFRGVAIFAIFAKSPRKWGIRGREYRGEYLLIFATIRGRDIRDIRDYSRPRYSWYLWYSRYSRISCSTIRDIRIRGEYQNHYSRQLYF